MIKHIKAFFLSRDQVRKENSSLKAENHALRDLIIHAHIHANYKESGRYQMTTKQQAVWDSVMRDHRNEVVDEILNELSESKD